MKTDIAAPAIGATKYIHRCSMCAEMIAGKKMFAFYNKHLIMLNPIFCQLTIRSALF